MYSRQFKQLTDYMILYPIKWYTFLNRILFRSTTYDNIIIINKNILENNRAYLEEIEELFTRCFMIKEKQENKDFILWYFFHKNQICFLDKWLSILCIRILTEFGIDFNYSSLTNDSFFIQMDSIRIYIENEEIVVKNLNQSEFKMIPYSHHYFSIKEQLKKILIAFF